MKYKYILNLNTYILIKIIANSNIEQLYIYIYIIFFMIHKNIFFKNIVSV
jgi:hypothetical protein